MKKIYLSLILLGATLLNSCSSETTPPVPSFKINGVTYELLSNNSESVKIVNFNSTPTEFGGQQYLTSVFTVSGLSNSNEAGSLVFSFFYKANQGIAGTYNITNMDDDLENDLIANQRTVNGWISSAIVTNGSSQNPVFEGNDPLGSVQVISNGNNNYTLKFNNVFRKFNENNQVISSFPVEIDLTATASIENF